MEKKINNRVFLRKNGSEKGGTLYKWSPPAFDSKDSLGPTPTSVKYCITVLGTQGHDSITTYCYNIVIVGNQQIREAYVQCDYVM